MRTEHPQTEVIDVLLDNSEEFRAFYSDNKTILEKLSIRWFERPSLVNGQCKQLLTGTFEIELKSIPPQIGSAWVVAHEIYHCILWHLGYPKLLVKSDYRQCLGVMAHLNSMVYDQYINVILSDYFDDGCQFFKLRSQQYFDKKLKDRYDIGDESEIMIIFVYANFRLNFEILCKTSDIQYNDFFNWFISNRQDIIAKSSELLSLIKSTDMDKPKDVKGLFQKIVNRFHSLEPIGVI